jgi:hypothetical protein
MIALLKVAFSRPLRTSSRYVFKSEKKRKSTIPLLLYLSIAWKLLDFDILNDIYDS